MRKFRDRHIGFGVTMPGGGTYFFSTLKARNDFCRTYQPTPDDIDELAIDIVCVERIPMPLVGLDRLEAIRRLNRKGFSDYEIADLIKAHANYVGKLRAACGLPPAPAKASPWDGLHAYRNCG